MCTFALCKKYTNKIAVMADDKKATYTYEYPRPSLTADCVVFSFDGNDLKVLWYFRVRGNC